MEEVNREIMRKFRDKNKCFKTTPNRMPEGRWLLEVLSSLNPNHVVFAKGYQPERATDPYLEIKAAHLK